MSIPLTYPSTISAKVDNLQEKAPKFSDNVGNDKYWGRTKPLFDKRLYEQVNRVGGLGFVRNDRGIIPNTVHLVASAGMATVSLQGSLSKTRCDIYYRSYRFGWRCLSSILESDYKTPSSELAAL